MARLRHKWVLSAFLPESALPGPGKRTQLELCVQLITSLECIASPHGELVAEFLSFLLQQREGMRTLPTSKWVCSFCSSNWRAFWASPGKNRRVIIISVASWATHLVGKHHRHDVCMNTRWLNSTWTLLNWVKFYVDLIGQMLSCVTFLALWSGTVELQHEWIIREQLS